jgi:hypothetical protein
MIALRPMKRSLPGLVAVLLVGGVLALALRQAPAPSAGAPTAAPESPRPLPAPASAGPRVTVGVNDPVAAAEEPAVLRRRLRTDPEARRRAAARLLARDTPAAEREMLAFVLGTLDRPDTDALLLEALRLYGSDPSFARCALLALGATREPEEDDDVFDLGDRPYGAKGPGGIGITVRRVIGDAAVRAALARALDRPEPAVREAAATSLRHSLDSPDARAAFLATLARETSDEVAPVLGEALAQRAGATPDGAERDALVAALLARAGEEGLAAFRFRIENDFHRIPLGPPHRAALADLASDVHPFGTRAFALTSLANAASRGDGQAEVRALLARLVAADPEAPVRDLAARLLGKAAPGEGDLAVLRKAAREDPAWNVRYTALEAYAARAPRETALEALREARADPDARVADLAARLLQRL